MSRPQFAFFLTHPVQYISPMLKALAKRADLNVYYFSDASIRGGFDKGFGQKITWDVPLLEGYQYRVLKNFSSTQTLSNRFFELINPGAIGAVRREPAKIIVTNGWMYFSIILTIIAAKIFGRQIWLRAENPLHQELRKRKWVIALKKVVLGKLLFPWVDRFLYIGSHNKAFFEYYGAKPQQLIYTPYCVDNERFQAAYGTLQPQRYALRQNWGIPQNAKVILSTAKYISQKRPLDLLAAFVQLNMPDTYLLMVGDGPMRAELETFIAEGSIKNVILTGFVNQFAIAECYAVADVFVLCSGMGETWGLSVNEAMNFALPVCASTTCGCSADLIENGINGFIFKEGDVSALAENLRIILSNEAFRHQAGAASLRLIDTFNIDTIIANLCAAAGGFN